MGSHIEKFGLLMWKNFLLQWRHPVQTAVEILAPVLFASILVIIRSLVDPHQREAVIYRPFSNSAYAYLPTIVWSPETPDLIQIMDKTIEAIDDRPHLEPHLEHKPFRNTEDMDRYLSNELVLKSIWAAVDFGDAVADKGHLPNNVEIIIRFPSELRNPTFFDTTWQTRNLFPMYQTPGPRSPNSTRGAYPGYESEGFLGLQKQLSYSIINHFKLREKGIQFYRHDAPIVMKRFSYPEWIDDFLITALQTFVGLFFMLSFVYTCINTVRIITIEKEKQLKEAMKIMGLPNWLHWTAWFIKTFVFLGISIAAMVILMKIPWYSNTDHTVFTYSDPLVLFVFLVLFISATITFCFAVSVFFSRANTAATVAGMAWFLSYFPYLLMQESYQSISLAEKLPASLLSNTAMAYGFRLILTFEGNEEGLQWNNVWKTTTPDDDLMFGHILIMLIIDTFIYLLIALYVEAVFPGEYGIPQVWYFPFTKSFWCGTSHNNYSPLNEDFLIQNESYEKEPDNLKVGIKIRNLRKEFKNRVAVKNVSLNIFQDQITILLGHNGAGKTTTMSMLTGIFPPSEGTAFVNDYDIHSEMNGVRKSLGICPQHNILFDELTVSEHIYFYSRLKGTSKKLAGAEISKYVELLELQPKATAKSSTLSGGMKRKLSVAVALCGDSSIVMCDEPTAGMDPSARRALWDLLQSQKKGRTILLTTHFMDEADLLGDRIAIMAHGEVQCCGSSFFLKKQYGTGYHLIMDTSLQCNSRNVTTLLQKYIPDIKVESNIGSELTYILNEEQSPIFETMLYDLETHSHELGINTYGISLTTLEEVFMKVGVSGHEINESGHDSNIHHEITANEWNEKQLEVEIGKNLLEGWPLWRNQILAMFIKRFLSIIRSWILLLIQNIIPVAFLVIAVVSVRAGSYIGDLPSLKIDLNAYKEPVTVITGSSNKYANAYSDILMKNGKKFIHWGDGNMDIFMQNETKEHTSLVRSRYIIGADFKDVRGITAYFNNNPLHSPPLALQTVLNAILQTEVSNEFTLQFYNYPLPFTSKTLLTDITRGITGGFIIAFNVAFSMAFTSAFYVMFCIRERVSKSKHLQSVSGISVLPFWCTTFVADFLTLMITFIFVLITFVILQEDGFKTAEDLGNVFIIFVYFGFSMLPMMYLTSYLFNVPSTGYTRMALFNIIVGVAGFVAVQIMSQPELELEDTANTVHWFLLFLPPYTFSAGIRDTNLIYTTHNLCKKLLKACINSTSISYLECKLSMCRESPRCCTLTKNYYDMELPGIGRNIIISFCVSAVLFAILLGIEYRLFDVVCQLIFRKLPSPTEELHEDDDVAHEKELIRNLPREKIPHYKLIMRDVTKYYNNLLAVNSICLGVKERECFGLLGINGAGKTTTFKMLTGDTQLSYGNAWVNGFNLKTEMKKVHQLIGYCPQFDALLDNLTARETLIIYGLIRGISVNESKMEAEHLAREFDFQLHLDKQIKALSGGNKRKISTAIALIGDPQVIYLDEPTTGMDPATKRYLWNALCKVRNKGKCIILTSHSMEECEALCTRLSIMVNGSFLCLGSTQHLKNKFSEGYTLTIKIKKAAVSGQTSNEELEKVQKFVNDNFQGVSVREKHQELITFYITDKSQPWSRMFGILEKGKMVLHIEDYSIGQSSLEQIFLSFTKKQRE